MIVKILRGILFVFGVLLTLSGLMWIGQGTGLIMWPESSFMLAQREWAVYGAITAAVGVLLIWLGKPRR